MDRLISVHRDHSRRGVLPEIQAAWIHHAFTQIHPYQDGNGRVARTLASIVLIKAGYFPLLVRRDEKEPYIRSLEAADRGDFRELVDLVVAGQRKAILDALRITPVVPVATRVEDVIAGARALLESRARVTSDELDKAKETAALLNAAARQRFQQVSEQLRAELGGLAGDYRFEVKSASATHPAAYVAEEAGPHGNLVDSANWTSLLVRTGSEAEIVLHQKSVGPTFQGVLALSVSIVFHAPGGGVPGFASVADSAFQVNYRDDPKDVLKRFEPWFESSLLKALNLWRKTL